MVARVILISALSLLLFSVNGQDVSFFKEDLTFSIEKGYFYVNGTYYLRRDNPQDTTLVLFYPFPVDTIYSRPDSVFLFNLNTGKEITGYQESRGGILFRTSLDSVTVLLISYRQALKGNRARYILTTTQYWGKALEQVTYRLITDGGTHITTFSYEPDRCENFGETRICYWEKEHFMPMKDMIFTFEYDKGPGANQKK